MSDEWEKRHLEGYEWVGKGVVRYEWEEKQEKYKDPGEWAG